MSQVAAVSCGDSRFAYPRRAVGIAQDGPRFDVASVKPNRDESKKMATPRMWGEPGGRLNLVHISVRYVLMHVFDLQEDQITGPGWLDSDYFDIAATIPQAARAEDIARMFQNLLAERFQLQYRLQKKDPLLIR